MRNSLCWNSSGASLVAEGKVTVLTTHRKAGQAVQSYDLFCRAWDECEELQMQSKDTWASRAVLSLQSIDRWEIGYFIGDELVGALCVADDQHDPHVYDCMSVFAQYVVPEHRGGTVSPRLMRAALQIARINGYHCFAYTHRVGAWRYTTTYKRIL